MTELQWPRSRVEVKVYKRTRMRIPRSVGLLTSLLMCMIGQTDSALDHVVQQEHIVSNVRLGDALVNVLRDASVSAGVAVVTERGREESAIDMIISPGTRLHDALSYLLGAGE